MSKSILVIDTPKNCRECNFRKHNEFGRCYVCAAKNNYMIDRDADIDVKPDWCPISPLPSYRPINEDIKRGDTKSMTHLITSIHDIGYNECLDAILKGKR